MGSKTESAPEFTIILPTHARKDVLGFAILSVLAQKESSFELLVVGDGAEDGTAEVVQTFEDRRIKWLNFPKAAGFGLCQSKQGTWFVHWQVYCVHGR